MWQDVQKAINRLEDKIDGEISCLRLDVKDLSKEVKNNTDWRNNITGKITIMFIFIGVGINFVMDYIKDKISK